MCGFAAIFAYRDAAPPVDADELGRINEAMSARGPDGEGAWINEGGRIGLAHKRLAIIDPSAAAAQPMSLDGGRLRITYNGEIYNFRALRAELESQGRRFASQSDTEVLLHLYDRDGAAMVERLRGMFAFALWDEAKRGLLLARDPFGIKPLYYADDGNCLRAASQVKALLAGGVSGGEADAAGHVGFFLFGYVPEPHTLYAGITALPAGTTLWLEADGKRRETRYFDAAAALAETAGGVDGVDDPEVLRAALADSVAHHLVADVPVGVFLSAGLDSATVLALASECSAAELDTITLGFDEFAGTKADEMPLAQEIAARFATRHHAQRVAGKDFDGERGRLLAAMDQPSIDGVNTYFVARAAAGMGLKVALSGLGGDELFGGYDTFAQVPALARLRHIPGIGAIGKALRVVSAPLIRHLTSPKYAGLFEYASGYGAAYLLRRALYMPWELGQVLDPELAARGWNQLEPVLRLEETAARPAGARAKVMALEMSWYMRGQLLRDADWAGMAHSLEIRTPLVDATLFAAVTGANWDKQAMARTPAKPLPPSVMARPKTGFSIPVRDWLGGRAGARGLRGWAAETYAHAWPGG